MFLSAVLLAFPSQIKHIPDFLRLPVYLKPTPLCSMYFYLICAAKDWLWELGWGWAGYLRSVGLSIWTPGCSPCQWSHSVQADASWFEERGEGSECSDSKCPPCFMNEDVLFPCHAESLFNICHPISERMLLFPPLATVAQLVHVCCFVPCAASNANWVTLLLGWNCWHLPTTAKSDFQICVPNTVHKVDVSSALAFFPVSTCTRGAHSGGPVFKPWNSRVVVLFYRDWLLCVTAVFLARKVMCWNCPHDT